MTHYENDDDPFSFSISKSGYLQNKVDINNWHMISSSSIIKEIKLINKDPLHLHFITIEGPDIIMLHINNTKIKLTLLRNKLSDVDIITTTSNPYLIYKVFLESARSKSIISFKKLIASIENISLTPMEIKESYDSYKVIVFIGSCFDVTDILININPTLFLYEPLYDFVKSATIFIIDSNSLLYISCFKLLYKIKGTKIVLPELFNQLLTLDDTIVPYKSELLELITNTEYSNENSYIENIKKYQYKYIKTNKDHLFYGKSINNENISSTTIRRIMTEVTSLQSLLPLSEDNIVSVRLYEDNCTLLTFIISGPKNTPYEYGLFEFCMLIPNDYPKNPPHILLNTTNNNTIRFNPNIYNSGLVCLSLLNTWSGSPEESWNPETSTIYQIILSIQSLILNEEPYFNEPGYESRRNTHKGIKSSIAYNKDIYIYTLKYAILEHIDNPPVGFEDFCKIYFDYHLPKIIKSLEENKYINKDSEEFQDLYKCFCKKLQK
jgi:ubiquitin-protein ligase